MTHYSAEVAAVITSSGFTPSARRLSATMGVVLHLHSKVDLFDEPLAERSASDPFVNSDGHEVGHRAARVNGSTQARRSRARCIWTSRSGRKGGECLLGGPVQSV